MTEQKTYWIHKIYKGMFDDILDGSIEYYDVKYHPVYGYNMAFRIIDGVKHYQLFYTLDGYVPEWPLDMTKSGVQWVTIKEEN